MGKLRLSIPLERSFKNTFKKINLVFSPEAVLVQMGYRLFLAFRPNIPLALHDLVISSGGSFVIEISPLRLS